MRFRTLMNHLPHSATLALSATTVTLLLAGLTSTASAEHLALDTFSVVNDGTAGPVFTSEPLKLGAYYTVTVRGTYSLWSSRAWRSPRAVTCGSPETMAFPSSGRPAVPGALDAEFLFARLATRRPCAAVPQPRPLAFQTYSGGTHERVGIGPHPGEPAADHVYRYAVVGRGEPLGFVLRDNRTDDNSGVLHIDVEEASPADCTGNHEMFAQPTEASCQTAVAFGAVGLTPRIARCKDKVAPLSTVLFRETSRDYVFSGDSTDLGCEAGNAGKVALVRLSVGREDGTGCRFMFSSGRFGRRVSCRRTRYVSASGDAHWRFSLSRRALPRGRYKVWIRGIDVAGNVERKHRMRNFQRLIVR